MNENTQTITAELLAEGRSDAGGWTRAQLALLGVPWPPLKGWKACILGKPLGETDSAAFLAGRGALKGTARTPE